MFKLWRYICKISTNWIRLSKVRTSSAWDLTKCEVHHIHYHKLQWGGTIIRPNLLWHLSASTRRLLSSQTAAADLTLRYNSFTINPRTDGKSKRFLLQTHTSLSDTSREIGNMATHTHATFFSVHFKRMSWQVSWAMCPSKSVWYRQQGLRNDGKVEQSLTQPDQSTDQNIVAAF